jgi:hypothetical protein
MSKESIMDNGNNNFFAVRKLLFCENKDGSSKLITVKFGRPYWIEENLQAACPIFIDGMFDEPLKIYGIDFFSAIDLSIKFVDKYLGGRLGQLFWESGEPYEGT